MSPGLISANGLLSAFLPNGFINRYVFTGMPSTIYKGNVPACKVDAPLMVVNAPEPGAPDTLVTCIPAACPCSSASIETAINSSMLFSPTTDTAADTLLFLTRRYPNSTLGSDDGIGIRIGFTSGFITSAFFFCAFTLLLRQSRLSIHTATTAEWGFILNIYNR